MTEAVGPVPKNIYGATKLAAETLCERFARKHVFLAAATPSTDAAPHTRATAAIARTGPTTARG
ncbi:MAG TPA: hypothetical protein DHL02_11285 [Achromobacter sp.]|nr:hypothetical protein [Achromobacter sp.]